MNLSLGAPRIYGWPDALLREGLSPVESEISGRSDFIHERANQKMVQNVSPHEKNADGGVGSVTESVS